MLVVNTANCDLRKFRESKYIDDLILGFKPVLKNGDTFTDLENNSVDIGWNCVKSREATNRALRPLRQVKSACVMYKRKKKCGSCKKCR
jgi:hypothetical protein